MKKGIKLTAAAALAVSAITPVAAFAAETTLAPGYYSSDEFMSVKDFAAKKTSEKKAFFKENFGKSNFIFVDASGKVYDFLGANGEKILNATDTELPKYSTTLAAYQTSKGVTVSESGIAKTTPDQKGELEVVSVSAINSRQVAIKFNQKVEEESAENLANYYVSLTKSFVLGSDIKTLNDLVEFDEDGVITAGGYKAELQPDGQTVIITAYNVDGEDPTYVIWRDANTPNASALLIDEEGNEVTKDKTTYIQARNIVQQSTGLKGNTVQDSFVASDKVGPKFAKTSFEAVPDATTFKVTFDETVFVTATTQFYFDGENITEQVQAGTWSNNGRTVEIELPNGSKLEEGTFKFEAVGLQDLSGNASAPNRIVTDIVVAEKEADTAAPKLIDIVQIHDGAFTLIFDKQVTQGTVTIKNLINDNTDAVIDLADSDVVKLPTAKIGGKGEFKDYYAVTVVFAAKEGSSEVESPFTPVDYNEVFKTTTNSIATEIYRTIELKEIATANSSKAKKSSTREKFVLDNIAPTFVDVEVVANEANEDLVISFVDNPFKGEILKGSSENPVILKFEEDGITYTYNVDTSDFSDVENNLVSLGLTPDNQPKLFDTNGKLKNGKYTITLPREYVKDNEDDETPQFLGDFEFVGLTTTFEHKGNTNEDVPQTAQRLVGFDSDLNAISVKFVGKNIDPSTAKNVANYKFDGEALPAGTVIEYTENTGVDEQVGVATGTALIYLPANSVERDGDYTLVVSNVATKNGAKMLTTTVQVEDVKDNTQPLFTSAVVTSNNTIELTFNETLSGDELGIAATTGDEIVNANRNLKVVIGGAEYTVDTVKAKTSKVLVITTVDVFDTAKTVQVKLAKDASGDIHIFDIAKNKAAEKTVTATKDIQ